MTDVVLHPGRGRSARRRHPWILSGAVARETDVPSAGALVRVLSAEGEVLGWGHHSPASQIRVRLLSFGKEAPPPDLLGQRLSAAVAQRAADPFVRDCDAVRLVNAEGDFLPGLVVDRYGDCLVVKLSSAGMIARREEISAALREVTGARAALERADAHAARSEGVAVQEGPLWGEFPEQPISVRERDRLYEVNVWRGQKTGFYLDQRNARDVVQELAEGRSVLDLFSYTGGFAVAAARGGARSVTLVDTSAVALEQAQRNLELNRATPLTCRVEEDAFGFVRKDGGPWDLIVVDPPPLARRRRDVPRAARAYKDVVLHALRRAAPGALLLVFACSHHVDPELFRKIVFGASIDAERPLRVLCGLTAPSDHPVALDHPEGAYLQGLLLQG